VGAPQVEGLGEAAALLPVTLAIATGRVADLRCGIIGKDGKSHADLGMVGEIVIE
jgi:hypothetical protein